MVELLRPDQGRIVKIDPRDKRIAELEAALRMTLATLDMWQGAAPTNAAQIKAREVLQNS